MRGYFALSLPGYSFPVEANMINFTFAALSIICDLEDYQVQMA